MTLAIITHREMITSMKDSKASALERDIESLRYIFVYLKDLCDLSISSLREADSATVDAYKHRSISLMSNVSDEIETPGRIDLTRNSDVEDYLHPPRVEEEGAYDSLSKDGEARIPVSDKHKFSGLLIISRAARKLSVDVSEANLSHLMIKIQPAKDLSISAG
jgi:hypothetical protein